MHTAQSTSIPRAFIEAMECRQLLAGELKFAVVGDFGVNDANELAVANQIKSWNPSLIVTVGDNSYPDASAALIDNNIGKYYGDYIYPYTGSYGSGSPTGTNRFFPTLGNHDWDSPSLTPYLDYFTLPNNERYYTFTSGPVQFFVIDSDSRESDGITSTSVQAQWLQQQLAASTTRWQFVFCHHPAYSSGDHGDTAAMQWPFAQWGADAVFSGHDHVYERLNVGGVPFFVDGTGGQPLTYFTSVSRYSQFRDAGDFGAMRVTANDTTATFEFVGTAGQVIDSYTIGGAVAPGNYLSDLPWVSATNAWGPVERDLSNGSSGTRDGRTITLKGVAYQKGLGAHANSRVVYDLTGGSYSTFVADVGLDDEILSRGPGRVRFQVVGDGRVLFDSGIVVNTTPTIHVEVSVAGVQQLALVVNDGGDGIDYDHSDWAGARLITAAPTAPAAPGNLSATAINLGQIDLSWIDASTDESGFRIERSADGGSSYTTLATVSHNVTTYSDTAVAPESTYTYRVCAYNAVGDSAFTTPASATTPAAPPAAPSGLSASVISASRIDLLWTDNSTSETGFRIERSQDNGATFGLVITVAAGITSYSDLAVAPATSYIYRVCATSSVGSSAYATSSLATTPQVPPAMPTNLVAAAITATRIDLAWIDASNNESGFRIERSTSADSGFAQIGSVGANVTSFSDTDAGPATTYYYRVFASNSAGDSDSSNTANAATPEVPPAAPGGLSASAISARQIDLSWTDNSTNETGFRIERSQDNGATFALVNTVAAGVTSYSDLTVSPATAYIYRVCATGSAGTSAYATSLAVSTPQVAPSAPTNLVATAISATRIDLTWTDASNNESGFRIERSTSASTGFAQIGSVGANVTSFSDTAAASATTYYYRVYASNSAGDSDSSDTASATTPEAPPAAPTSLAAAVISASRIDLTWLDNSANETGFRIERSQDGGATFTLVNTVAAGVTTYSDLSVAPATSYIYRVCATGTAGTSAYATSSAISTPQVAPSAPTNLVATAISATRIDLTWTDASNNESGFRIERSTSATTGFAQIGSASANVTSFSDMTAAAGTTYYYRVYAWNSAGNSAYTNTASAATPSTALPAGWSSRDIGSVGLAGSSTYSGGVYTLRGAGADIWNTSDAFQFASRTLSGDGQITARVSSVSNTNSWAKAGVMIRESLAANARFVGIYVTPGQGISLQYRTKTGGSCGSITTSTKFKAPYWVRLVRSGSTFTGYYSANGTTWTRLGSVSMALTPTTYMGLAVTAHNNSALCTATFDSVDLTGVLA